MNTVFFLVSLALLFAATGGGCYCVGLREGKRSRDVEISSLKEVSRAKDYWHGRCIMARRWHQEWIDLLARQIASPTLDPP